MAAHNELSTYTAFRTRALLLIVTEALSLFTAASSECHHRTLLIYRCVYAAYDLHLMTKNIKNVPHCAIHLKFFSCFNKTELHKLQVHIFLKINSCILHDPLLQVPE